MNYTHLSIEGHSTINEGETRSHIHKLHAWFKDPITGEIVKVSKEVTIYFSFPKYKRYKPTRAQSRETIRCLLRRA